MPSVFNDGQTTTGYQMQQLAGELLFTYCFHGVGIELYFCNTIRFTTGFCYCLLASLKASDFFRGRDGKMNTLNAVFSGQWSTSNEKWKRRNKLPNKKQNSQINKDTIFVWKFSRKGDKLCFAFDIQWQAMRLLSGDECVGVTQTDVPLRNSCTYVIASLRVTSYNDLMLLSVVKPLPWR